MYAKDLVCGCQVAQWVLRYPPVLDSACRLDGKAFKPAGIVDKAMWQLKCSLGIAGMPLPPAEPEREIVKQILSYFVRNPQAADSVEGIARWRLLEEQGHRTLKETETALAWLVAEGFLSEVQTGGSSRIFRLNQERHAEALTYLASEARKP